MKRRSLIIIGITLEILLMSAAFVGGRMVLAGQDAGPHGQAEQLPLGKLMAFLGYLGEPLGIKTVGIAALFLGLVERGVGVAYQLDGLAGIVRV